MTALGIGGLVVVLSCLVFYSFGTQKPLLISAIDNRVMDIMFRIRGPGPVTHQVVIVDIDEKSLGRIGQWPWPRNILSELTRIIFAQGVRSLGFDIIFAEPDRTSPAQYFREVDPAIREKIPPAVLDAVTGSPDFDYDAMLGTAVSQGPSILGYAFLMKPEGPDAQSALPFPGASIETHPPADFGSLMMIAARRAVVNIPAVAQSQSEGFINVFTEPSGITRRVPLVMKMDDIPYPSLALEVYRVGMNIPSLVLHTSGAGGRGTERSLLGISLKDGFIPTDRLGQIFINYRGPVGTFTYVSALDLLEGRNLDRLKGKFVILGSSSAGLFDLRATPFARAIPGIEINANIIDNLINQDAFQYDVFSEIGWTYLMLGAGGMILTAILAFFGPMAGGIGAFIFLGLSVVVNYQVFFLSNRYMGMAYPWLTWVALLVCLSIFNYAREGRSRQFIQKAFSHYVAPDLVKELIRNPQTLSLKGRQMALSVLFCDIRNFTSISETMDPQDLVVFMNEYLTRMSRIIMEHGGTVDKFIGDAVMAFWGAPGKDAVHYRNAVLAALEMIRALEGMRGEFARLGLPGISIGIGINTGEMRVGNFGSADRFDYTVMGDNVNLASRLEGANKNYGTTLLVSSHTRAHLGPKFFCRYVDRVQVKGRKEPVDIYEPILYGIPDSGLVREVEAFENAVSLYQKGRFIQARPLMAALNEKNPLTLYQVYLNRIDDFIRAGAPDSWEGIERRQQFPVHRLKTK